MKPFKMALEAARLMSLKLEWMTLVLPRRVGRGRRMAVLKAKGMSTVFGEPVSENHEGHAVVKVKAVDALAWLTAAGLIEVDVSHPGRLEITEVRR